MFKKPSLGSYASKRLKEASLLIHYVFENCRIYGQILMVHIYMNTQFCSNTRRTIPREKHMKGKQLFYSLIFLWCLLPLKVCECFVSKADLYKDKECVFTCVVWLTKHACKGHQNSYLVEKTYLASIMSAVYRLSILVIKGNVGRTYFNFPQNHK